MKVTLYLILMIIFPLLSNAANSCNCWQTRDTTWSVVPFDGTGVSGGPGLPPDYRNDDWSTLAIPLPFNFCFYGDTIHDVIINNNGNVSIGAAYSTFTANSFPDPTYKMVAPFWSDVDTRGALSGIVYFKVFSHYIVIQWDSVGYFQNHDDLLNTYQLIISDGGSSPLPEQKNIGFCYKTMQWTTGDASGGALGFGGTPATVGVNYGDGVNFLQIGLYDNASITYDGPYNNNDGVASLTDQSFAFNVCVNNFNVPPILSGQYVCDTIHMMVGDTFSYSANFIAPEQSQITNVSYNPHGLTGVNFTTIPGNQASLSLSFVATTAGIFTIDVTGTDNGSPAAYTTYPLIFDIQSSVGISNISLLSHSVSPNPFTNELKYSFTENQDVRITDPSGKTVYVFKNAANGSINTTEWKNGLYFMYVTSEKGSQVVKLLKN